MSNFYVDGQITGPSFQQGFDLSSILTTICDRHDDKVVKVQITEPGVYYLKSALQLKCNLVIEGCEGVVVAVKFSSDNDYNYDDCFMLFKYITTTVQNTTTYIRPNVVIKDVEFRIDEGHHWHSEKNKFYFLKFYWAESIHVDNVKMKLEGKHITNVDMRECENVIVDNCLLEKYHNNTEQLHGGGILWIRGMTRNVKITNNIFRKSGNDEVLAFFGHFADYHNQSNPAYNFYIIPQTEEPDDGVCHKENIIVENNVFSYEKHYSNSNINDCLITLIDITSNPDYNYKHVYNNLVFENNTIIINDLVKKVFACMNREETIIRNVCFVNNKICLNDFTATSTTSLFYLDNQSSEVDSIYQIKGTNVYNKAKIINENKTGLYFLVQNGGVVSVLDNVIRIFEDSDVSSQLYRRFYFLFINKRDSCISVQNNYIHGCHRFGSISGASSSGDEAINYAEVLVKNNFIKGDSRIYNKNVGELNVSIEDNCIESENDVIAIQDYGTSGKFIYINNRVVSKFSGTPTFYYTNTGCNASRVCIANNIFENVTSVILTSLHNYTSSSIRTEVNNIYLS